jgi:hypothetical protein
MSKRKAALMVLLLALFACPGAVHAQALPVITEVLPTAAPPQTATGPGIQLSVYGTGFESGATVLWNGIALSTMQVSVVELSAKVPASRMLVPKTATIAVSNPGGVISVNTFPFQVTVPTEPPGALNFQPAAVGIILDSNLCGKFGNDFVVADFTGDGIKDIVCGPDPTIGTGLFLWPGKADGSFGPAETILSDSAGVVSRVTEGDFLRNGQKDLLVSTQFLGEVLLVGNGNGTFQPPIEVPGINTSQQAPLLGDFNGDGKLDVVLIFSCPNCSIETFLGNGNGTFQPPLFTNIPSYGLIAAGDWNGDGIPDVAIADPLAVSVYLGDGTGTFALASTTPWPSKSMTPAAIMGVDWNNDGKLDMGFVYSSGSNSLVTMLGNGDGTFTSPQQQIAHSSRGLPITLVDINGDGFMDVVYVPNSSGALAYFGRGDGTFSSGPVLSGSAVVAAAADVNKDGRLDLITSSPPIGGSPAGFEVWVQVGSPGPLKPSSFSFGNQKVGTVSPAKAFIFRNSGSAPVYLSSVTLPAGFLQTNACAIVSPKTSCAIKVKFAPTETKTYEGNLTVTFKPTLAGPLPTLTAAILGQGI